MKLEESVSIRPAGSEAMWSAAAREQRVVVGMPKPFVTEALGAPAEIRAPRSGESGTEVWVYAKAGQTTRLGFVNNAVAWMRSDSAAAEARPQCSVDAAAAPGADRESRIREALAVGKTCTAALQDAGPPDREEPLSAGTTTGARYVYLFDPANANAFAAFVCLNGRVTSVERYVPARGSTNLRIGDPGARAPGTLECARGSCFLVALFLLFLELAGGLVVFLDRRIRRVGMRLRLLEQRLRDRLMLHRVFLQAGQVVVRLLDPAAAVVVRGEAAGKLARLLAAVRRDRRTCGAGAGLLRAKPRRRRRNSLQRAGCVRPWANLRDRGTSMALY